MGRSRSKEKPRGGKRAPVAPYLLKTWGPSKKVLWKTPVEALGAVLVLAISIFLASGLRRKLTHSDARPLPPNTAALGLRGGPIFLKLSVVSPRPGIARLGYKTDLVCSSFRYRSRHRPGSAKRSGCARRRVSEANRRKAAALRPEMSAEREAGAIRQPPRKPLRAPKCGHHFPCSPKV